MEAIYLRALANAIDEYELLKSYDYKAGQLDITWSLWSGVGGYHEMRKAIAEIASERYTEMRDQVLVRASQKVAACRDQLESWRARQSSETRE